MKFTKYLRMPKPEVDDLAEIADSYNAAMDILDNRIGSVTEQAWQTWTPVRAGFTTSAHSGKYVRFNKSLIGSWHGTISTVTGAMELGAPLPLIGGEAEYGGEDDIWDDCYGYGYALDVSTGLYYNIDMSANFTDNRFYFAGSTAFNATSPFTWAAGDIVSVMVEYQVGFSAP